MTLIIIIIRDSQSEPAAWREKEEEPSDDGEGEDHDDDAEGAEGAEGAGGGVMLVAVRWPQHLHTPGGGVERAVLLSDST